ncbi:MAG TPA: hypothetical protein PLX89_26550, partial [Verrucomicrobiota bacterium]|nr:hypothetical protein [Verrucomicrobiota bacterium]
FLEPTPGSAYLVGTEIPLSLIAEVPREIVTSADVFVDGQPAGTAIYCCILCRCPPPPDGTALVLRLPRSPDEGSPDSLWRGLTNLAPGFHTIHAVATGSGGTALQARPIQVTVLAEFDLTLRVSVDSQQQLFFVLPGGSLVMGGFDMWLSHDLQEWTRLGPFEPGNVAAFFRDQPAPNDPGPRFYRALPAKAD